MDINQIKLDNKFKLVEASAGTGKSFTLAHIVLRNVLEKKVKPDEFFIFLVVILVTYELPPKCTCDHFCFINSTK